PPHDPALIHRTGQNGARRGPEVETVEIGRVADQQHAGHTLRPRMIQTGVHQISAQPALATCLIDSDRPQEDGGRVADPDPPQPDRTDDLSLFARHESYSDRRLLSDSLRRLGEPA